ncbi:MAG TPA: hypothetical protein VKA91_11450 [Nitrososphaeraceae archaeon]|nr:hypothetical protein [Nitrososphaeraceae archaeon]
MVISIKTFKASSESSLLGNGWPVNHTGSDSSVVTYTTVKTEKRECENSNK